MIFFLLLDILTNLYHNYVQPPLAIAVILSNTTQPTTTTTGSHFGRFEPRERTGCAVLTNNGTGEASYLPWPAAPVAWWWADTADSRDRRERARVAADRAQRSDLGDRQWRQVTGRPSVVWTQMSFSTLAFRSCKKSNAKLKGHRHEEALQALSVKME